MGKVPPLNLPFLTVSWSSFCASRCRALQGVMWSWTAGPQVQTSFFLPLPCWWVPRGSGCSPFSACTLLTSVKSTLLGSSILRVIGGVLHQHGLHPDFMQLMAGVAREANGSRRKAFPSMRSHWVWLARWLLRSPVAPSTSKSTHWSQRVENSICKQ